MKILLIEESTDMGRLIAEILKLKPITDEMIQVATCDEGMEALEKDAYDLALLDPAFQTLKNWNAFGAYA